MDMCNHFRKLIIIIATLANITAFSFAVEYTWTGGDSTDPNAWNVAENWSPNTGYPQNTDDTAIIPADTETTINIDTVLNIYGIFVGTGSVGNALVTLNTSENITLSNNLTLGDAENAVNHSVSLKLTGSGNITATAIDMPNSGTIGYSFKVDIDENINLSVNTIFANSNETGSPGFTFTGNGSLHAVNIDAANSTGNTYLPSLTANFGDWTLSSSRTNNIFTITIDNSTAFTSVYAEVTQINNDSTTTESFADLPSTGTMSFSSATTQSINITIPSAIDENDGFSIDVYTDSGKIIKIGSATYQADNPISTWNGTWDITPWFATRRIIVAAGATLSGFTDFNNAEIVNNGTIELAGSETNIDTSKISNGSGSTIKYNGTSTNIWGGNYENLIVSGNLTTNSSVSINDSLTITNSGTINTTDNVTISGDLENDGTVSGTGNITISGDLENSGSWTNTGTVTFENAAYTSTISGTASFNELICTTPGKTLIFNAADTFTIGTLTITGNSGSKVTLKSTSDDSEWNLTCTSASIEYADIKDCKNIQSTFITANYSKDSGNNTNFNFPGNTYVFEGTTDTDWFTNTNWNPKSVPGTGALVEISSDATLDLNGNSIEVDTITNAGRIRLKGNETITATKINGTDSTIEYYNDCNVLPWGQSYQNLEFTGSATATISSTMPLTIASKVLINTTGDLNFYSGDNLTIQDGAAAGNLTIDATGKTITLEGGLAANTVDFTASTVKLTENGTLTGTTYSITGNLTNNGTVTSNAVINVSGDFTNSSTGNFTNSAEMHISKDLTNRGTFDGIKDVYVSGTFTDLGTWENTGKIYLNGTSNQLFIANPSTTYTNVISNNTVGIETTYIFKTNDFTATTGNVYFKNGGSITNAPTLSTTGTVTFNDNNNTGTFTIGNSTSFANLTHIAGDTIINGTLNAADVNFYNTTINGTLNITGNYSNTGSWTGDGKIKFSGITQTFTPDASSTYNIEAATTSSLTVNSPATITTFTQTSGNTTFRDTVTITTYADNTSSTGNITFTATTTITNDAMFDTTGTVQFGTSGTSSTTTSNITHTTGDTVINGTVTSGTFTAGQTSITGTVTSSGDYTSAQTTIDGTINANKITLGATSITGANVLLNGTEIQTGALTTSASTNNLTCQASSGKITINGLGTSSAKFNTVTFDSVNQDMNFNANGTTLYATKVIFKSSDNKNVSLTGLTLSDELSLNTSAIVELHGVKVPKLSFATSPLTLKLSGIINITGTDGFITPLASVSGVPVVLTDNTTIESEGPITLFDNISGNYSLEIKNTGLFTFNDATSGNDTDYGATLGSFTQTGTGTTTISGDIFADNSVSINSAITLDGDLKLNAQTVTFKSSIAGTHDLTTNSTTTILDGSAITINDVLFTVNGDLKNIGNNTVSNTQITVKNTLTNEGHFTNNSTISIQANFTDTDGTWQTGVGTIILNGTGNQSFNPKTTTEYNLIEINKTAGSVNFTADCKIATCTITANPQTTFTGSTTIATYTDTNASGNVTFANGGSITNASETTFNTTDNVTFGDETTDTFTFGTSPTLAAVTHTTGNTIIIGTLNSGITEFANTILSGTINSESTKLATTTLRSNSVINATTGNIEFTDKISGSDGSNYELTLNSPGEIIITTTTLKKLTFDGNVATSVIKLSNSITTTEDIIIPFNVELIAPATFNIPNTFFNNDTETNLGNYDFTVNGNVSIQGANIFTGASGNAVFTGDCTGDCIINANGKNVTFDAILTTKNLYLFAANLILKKNITTQNDFVLFGNNYNTTDQQSENTGIYVYQYNSTPTATAGTLQTDGGITVKAGRNFYANGITATSLGEWNLQLKANKNTNENFAQAYYCNFTASQCRISSFNSTETNAVMIEEEECTVATGYEEGWDLETFEITDAYTVDDDVVCIVFNRPVRNIGNILNTNANRILHSSGTFINTYTTADCTNQLPESASTYSTIYIKADQTWNTDATGTTTGNSIASTDKENNHKEVKPYVDIKRNVTSESDAYKYFITDLYGKRLQMYSYKADNSFKIYDTVHDKCNPVFTTVKTGQENHEIYNTSVGIDSQHSYDAHNFIEFTYSEPVNFGSQNTSISDIWIPAREADDSTFIVENIQVTDKFGAATTDISASEEAGFTLKGFGTIEKGRIFTGLNGETNKYVNALYRDNQYSIRLSIAGYTDGTVTDRSGNIYKKWIGYIENAKTPSGNVTIESTGNSLVTDLIGNIQMPVPENVNITINSTTDGTYSVWDTSEPVFAPLRLKSSSKWSECEPTDDSYYEAVGNNSGNGSTLDRIEFHLFDNTPNYSTDEFAWLTEKGWCFSDENQKENLYKPEYSYCADIFGGARQFIDDPDTRTHGGIRFSTISNISGAFKYTPGQTETSIPDKNFSTSQTNIGAKAPLFTGSSATRRSADELDGLYFSLELSESDYPLEQSFTVQYDEKLGIITDLAGNRLRSTKLKTIDRTPPAFDFILGPINQNELYMVFVKELMTTTDSVSFIDDSGNAIPLLDTFENIMPTCFELFSINNETGAAEIREDIQIDYSKPAVFEHIKSNVNSQPFTVVRLKLTNNITLSSVENLYVRLKNATDYPEFSQDPITGLQNSRVTFIQDELGNYMQMYEAHTLSDFAINVINPLYAYDLDMIYNDEIIMDGMFENGSWAVHDWNKDQQNYGTLPANHPYDIVAEMDDGTSEKQNMPAGVRIYLSDNPTPESVSKQYNSDLNQNLRIWLPEVTDSSFPFLALTNNAIGNYYQTDSTLLAPNESTSKINFVVPKEITEKWGSEKQVSFLFGLLDSNAQQIRVFTSPYYDVTNDSYNLSLSTSNPLYAIRLLDSTDITSLDLWSFKTRSITEQRGGVTILNNVINPLNGEKVAIKVNMASEGKLNVMIMTLDGNIITYLNHGNTTGGEHYYSWNGTNKNGKAVGRGMYFVRVVGNGIDETRKVMIVK